MVNLLEGDSVVVSTGDVLLLLGKAQKEFTNSTKKLNDDLKEFNTTQVQLRRESAKGIAISEVSKGLTDIINGGLGFALAAGSIGAGCYSAYKTGEEAAEMKEWMEADLAKGADAVSSASGSASVRNVGDAASSVASEESHADLQLVSRSTGTGTIAELDEPASDVSAAATVRKTGESTSVSGKVSKIKRSVVSEEQRAQEIDLVKTQIGGAANKWNNISQTSMRVGDVSSSINNGLNERAMAEVRADADVVKSTSEVTNNQYSATNSVKDGSANSQDGCEQVAKAVQEQLRASARI